MSRIFGFDFARAFAISLVVLAHLHQGSQEIGIYGVELFFALSGFLIGTILYRCIPDGKPWNLSGVRNFWARRWWRTLPAYYLFLMVAVVHHSMQGELPDGGLAGVLPYLLFVPNLMSPNEVFYDVSWSLCIEEGFYLVFPLLILCFHRLTESRLVSFVSSLTVIVLGCFVLREVAFAAYPAAQVRVISLPRLDAIGYGVAMAVLMQVKDFSLRTRVGLAFVGGSILACIFVAHFLERPLDHALWFFRIGLFAMPFAFSLMMPLLAVWNQLPAVCERFRRPVTAISLWSYSIYLCHHTVMMAIYPLFGVYREHFAVKMVTKVVAIVAILLIARFVYKHFESRLTRLRPAERHVNDTLPLQEGVEIPGHTGGTRLHAAHSTSKKVGSIAE